MKKKLKLDGTIEKYKARLVTKSFRKIENIDLSDTFSSVIRIISIRMLISIVVIYNLIVHQINIKNTFLNGDLEEKIYMRKWKGLWFIDKKKKRYVSLISLCMVLKKP